MIFFEVRVAKLFFIFLMVTSENSLISENFPENSKNLEKFSSKFVNSD